MTTDSLDEGFEGQETPLDRAVTPDLFLEWRTPRFGRTNPERMNNPVWEWLIRSRLSAYQAGQRFNGPSALRAGPGWCFDRFGQSSTALPDGRTILVAGEHEDYYDPDFYIYNDVVLLHPNGAIDIFGYPAEVFPPTDFHTATLVGDRIIIIGTLGYPEQRKSGTTPVMLLDVPTLAISAVNTFGQHPGWIHEHEALLEPAGKSIQIRRGKLDRGGEDTSLVENIDDWRLHLADWRWERITARRWPRWEIIRQDRKPNHLWQIQQAIWARTVRQNEDLETKMQELEHELGSRPDLDLVEKLFNPETPHEQIPANEDEYNVWRINVQDVVVRYVADSHSIMMTAEGDLAPDVAKSLAINLAQKMTELENAHVEARVLA
jgi:hypothetical protein